VAARLSSNHDDLTIRHCASPQPPVADDKKTTADANDAARREPHPLVEHVRARGAALLQFACQHDLDGIVAQLAAWHVPDHRRHKLAEGEEPNTRRLKVATNYSRNVGRRKAANGGSGRNCDSSERPTVGRRLAVSEAASHA
jgi:hypothetical protein